MFIEEFNRLVHGHFQYIKDVLVVEFHFQCVGFETFPVAGFTFQNEVCHELHFYGNGAFTLTFFATSAFTVETEETGGISHLFGEWLLRP